MMDDLLTSKEMAAKLKVSVDHLLDLCKDGTLQSPKHFIDLRKRNSAKACYRFKVEPCLQRFGISPDKRS